MEERQKENLGQFSGHMLHKAESPYRPFYQADTNWKCQQQIGTIAPFLKEVAQDENMFCPQMYIVQSPQSDGLLGLSRE